MRILADMQKACAETGSTPWTVHDGQFFSRHMFQGAGCAPQERKLCAAASSLPSKQKLRHSSSCEGRLVNAAPTGHSPRAAESWFAAPCHETAAHAVRSWWLLDGVSSNLQHLAAKPRRVQAPKITELPKSVVDVLNERDSQHWRRVLLAWFELGGDINATDGAGRTLLHYAAATANDAAAELLMERGARLELPTSKERLTPLFLASMAGNDGIVARLIAAGANPDAVDKCKISPLMIACRSGHVSTVRKLVEAGASLKRTDAGGNDAWSYAARNKAVTIALRQSVKKHLQRAKSELLAPVIVQ